MLTAEDVKVSYGTIDALFDVSVDVEPGKVSCILGRNGAGKTSLLNAIMGLVPYKGAISFEGSPLPRDTRKVVLSGVVMVPERRRIFSTLSVEDNLKMGGYTLLRAEIPARLRQVHELFPRLAERRKQLGGTLSGGEQQMLAIGRALMARPKILLLDEPSLGLAPQVVTQVLDLIRQIRQSGVGVLLVEQNVHQALEVADTAYVLENGRVVLSGQAGEIRENPAVRSAYLGPA